MLFWRSYVNDIALTAQSANYNLFLLITTKKHEWASEGMLNDTVQLTEMYQHSCNHPVFQLQKSNTTAHCEHITWNCIYFRKVVQCPQHAILELYIKPKLKMCFLVKQQKMVEPKYDTLINPFYSNKTYFSKKNSMDM